MTNQSEAFGRLLRGAINSIAAYEGKAAAAVEEELGATIQRYKNGTLPPEPRTVQILAEAAVRRGFLGRAWLHGSTDIWTHPRGVAVLEDELDNLRAALGWSVETGDVLPGLVMGKDFQFWGERTNEGWRWLAALLAHPLPIGSTAADAWYSAAWLAFFDRDYMATRAGIETAYRLISELGEPTHPKSWNLGYVALGEGDVPGAGVLFEQFLADERATLNRDVLMAWGHCGFGSYYLMADDPVEAQTQLEVGLTLFRAANVTLAVLDTLQKLGLAALMRGDLSGAVAYFRESIEPARARRYRRIIAHVSWASLALR